MRLVVLCHVFCPKGRELNIIIEDLDERYPLQRDLKREAYSEIHSILFSEVDNDRSGISNSNLKVMDATKSSY